MPTENKILIGSKLIKIVSAHRSGHSFYVSAKTFQSIALCCLVDYTGAPLLSQQ
jgi:hypothetical protein